MKGLQRWAVWLCHLICGKAEAFRTSSGKAANAMFTEPHAFDLPVHTSSDTMPPQR
jgi:hypothetical protein